MQPFDFKSIESSKEPWSFKSNPNAFLPGPIPKADTPPILNC